ncbi:MAG: hypothetical protein Q9226_002008 [Calogaya cf. arnoldii]
MPVEILVRICECVKGWQPDVLRRGSFYAPTITDIKNLRLACWRLCNTSSHLLLPFVRVELNQTSVDHLNTISRHPTIRKGVRDVRIVLDYYDYKLADDFFLFAEYSAAILGDFADFLDIETSPEFGDQRWTDMESIQKTRCLQETCTSFASGAVDDPTIRANPNNRKLLQRMHEEYRSRATAQKELCTNGKFVGNVAAAISRMPRLGRLELRERDLENSFPWKKKAPLRAGEDDYFPWWMLRRMTWDEGRHWMLGTPHMEILNDLPVAVHDGGIILRSLNINISSLPEAYGLLTAEEIRSLRWECNT